MVGSAATISALPVQPRVSVALCTFNGGRFLAQQLESIVRQNRPIDELILCDDGSSDDTLAVAERFRSRIPSLQVHRNPTRLGVTKNFEQAIGRCSGEIIFLCDQDDIWHEMKVAKLLPALDASAAMAFSDAEVVGEDGSPVGYRLWDSIWFDAAERRRMADGEALPVLLRHAVAAGCTLAFRSAYRPLLLPMPDLPHVHDVWIALLLGCVGRIVPVDEALVSYRLHRGNTVGMRKYDLLGQVRMARWQLRIGAFGQLAALHGAAIERLESQSGWAGLPGAAALLEAKVRHSRIRDELPGWGRGRWRAIGSEWRTGNYGRFSYGFKSVLQDVFLR